MSNPSFGIPPAARKVGSMLSLLVKTGEKDKNGYPVSLDYFKVGTQVSKKTFKEHPDFPPCDSSNRPRSLRIVLCSDSIADMWRDSLTMYDGRQRFCYNNQGGTIAMRRTKTGSYAPCECHPNECALYNGNTVEVQKDWVSSYPYAKLTTMVTDKKLNKKIPQALKCKPSTYFFFKLLSPDGERMLTQPGSRARLYTVSANTNKQIMGGLLETQQNTGGILAGIECNLVIQMIADPFGGKAATVGLVGPTAEEIPMALRAASRRRGELDGTKMIREMAAMTEEQVAAVDQNFIYENFTRGADLELPEYAHAPLALPERTDNTPTTFCTDSPLVAALMMRLGIGKGTAGAWQMKYGSDEFSAVQELRQFAADRKDKKGNPAPVDISDLLKHFGGDIIDAEYEDIVNTTPQEAHLKSVNQADRGNPPASGSVSASQTESTDEGSPDIEMPPLFSDDPEELKE